MEGNNGVYDSKPSIKEMGYISEKSADIVFGRENSRRVQARRSVGYSEQCC